MLLEAESGPGSLIHGDMHPGNVLAASSGELWIIDPYGLAGSPAFDLGRYPVLYGAQSADVLRELMEGYQRPVPYLQEHFERWCLSYLLHFKREQPSHPLLDLLSRMAVSPS